MPGSIMAECNGADHDLSSSVPGEADEAMKSRAMRIGAAFPVADKADQPADDK